MDFLAVFANFGFLVKIAFFERFGFFHEVRGPVSLPWGLLSGLVAVNLPGSGRNL